MRFLLSSILCVLVSTSAAAGPEAKSNSAPGEPARVLASEAQAEFYLGHYRIALKLFEQLFRIKQVPALLFNVAQCHRKLGEFAEAANTYRSFLLHAARDSVEAKNAQELLGQVEAAIKQGDVATRSPPNEPMQATREEPAPKVLILAPPTTTAAPPVERAAMAVAAPPPPPRSHVAAWTLGGAGAAALATGLFFGAKSSSAGSGLANGGHTQAQVDSLSSTKSTDAKVADALFIVALGLGFGGVIAW